MRSLLVAVLLGAAASPGSGQDLGVLASAGDFARKQLHEIGFRGVLIVLDERPLPRMEQSDTVHNPPMWTQPQITALAGAAELEVGRLDLARGCAIVFSAGEGCENRRAAAVIRVGVPVVIGGSAKVTVALTFWSDWRKRHTDATEVRSMYGQVFGIELADVHGEWRVTKAVPGPPGMSVVGRSSR
jgi:hypothetical protein